MLIRCMLTARLMEIRQAGKVHGSTINEGRLETMTNTEIKFVRGYMEAQECVDVRDLCRECLVELKCAYLTELANEGTFAEVLEVDYDAPSYEDLADADEIVPDDVIFEHYKDYSFSTDDFFCLMETEG